MSARAEKVLFASLCDRDALEMIVRARLDDYLLPSDDLRPIYNFARRYYTECGGTKAPTPAAILSEPVWQRALDDHGYSLEDPEDSVEWAIEQIRGTYATRLSQEFATALVQQTVAVTNDQRPEVIADKAGDLVRLAMAVMPDRQVAEGAAALSERIDAYNQRVVERGRHRGLHVGYALLDRYTGGIHPGEVAVLAAGAKVGKSWALVKATLEHWRAGGSPILYTLENSVEMTLDRLLCLACDVEPTAWERGQCAPEVVERVQQFVESLDNRGGLWIVQPPAGRRTPEHLISEARIHGADAVLIDQLTFVDPGAHAHRERHLTVRNIMHVLKTLVSAHRTPLPLLLAHQINREGMKAAEKTGRHEMIHLAESSEVERTADWVFALYQSRDQRVEHMAVWQSLASRRADLSHFDMRWHPGRARLEAMGERFLTEAA